MILHVLVLRLGLNIAQLVRASIGFRSLMRNVLVLTGFWIFWPLLAVFLFPFLPNGRAGLALLTGLFRIRSAFIACAIEDP
jgi:hypothetical protein